MSVSEDSGAPAVLTGSTTWASKTSAAFSCSAGTLVLVEISGSAGSTSDCSASVADSNAVSYTAGPVEKTHQSGTLGGLAGFFLHYYASAQTSITVTVTASGPSLGGYRIAVKKLLGADPTQSGATATQGSLGSPTIMQANLTPTAIGNQVYGCAVNYDDSGAGAVISGTTADGVFADTTNGDWYGGFKSTAATTSTSSTAFGYSTSKNSMVAVIEIQAAAGATPITGTDSATGTDSSAVAATVSSTDSATGTDTSSVSATSSSTDSATGADASAISAAISSISENAKGTDTSSVLVPITGTDSAAGTDASAVTATSSSTDAGTGTDGSAVLVPLSSTDSGTGTDASSVSVITGSSDSASGSDSSSVDTGGPGAVHIFTTQTPATTAFDSAVTVGTQFTVDDTETVVSLRYFKKSLYLTESVPMGLWDGSGTLIASASRVELVTDPDDWIEIPCTPVSISAGQTYTVGYHTPDYYAFTSGELATAVDNPPLHSIAHGGCFTYGGSLVQPTSTSDVNWYADVTLDGGTSPISGSDSATGDDESAVTVLTSSTDAATGTDASSVAATLASTDAAAGTDQSSISATLASTDAGAGADSSSVAATLASTDSATGTDSSSVVTGSNPSSTDSAIGSDASSVAVTTAASTDLATGSDSSSILRLIGSSDSAAGDDTVTDITISDVDTDATGTDTATIFVILGSGDSATGSDSSSVLQTGNNPASGDSGTGSDSSALSATLASIDAGTGLDLAGLVATLTSIDAGAGSDSSNVSIGLISINSGDSGTGTDAASVSVALSSSDLAAALDNGNLWVPIVSSDSVTLVEVSHVGSPTGRNITITGPAVSFTRWLATVSFDQWPATFSS